MTAKTRTALVTLLALLLMARTVWPSLLTDPLRVVFDFNGAVESGGIPRPWSLKVRSGKGEARIVREDGGNALLMKCVDASFSVERAVSISPGEFPLLLWEWKAEKLPPGGDVRRRGRNDQGLQVLLAFEDRRVISYIWDSNAPVGTVVDESIGWPFSLQVKTVVVESGDADINAWISQRRNIYEDYERFFHAKPSRLVGLRLQANTQYTKDTSEGFVKHIIFSRDTP
jgi:Protein of unknown function (DUF3047)